MASSDSHLKNYIQLVFTGDFYFEAFFPDLDGVTTELVSSGAPATPAAIPTAEILTLKQTTAVNALLSCLEALFQSELSEALEQPSTKRPRKARNHHAAPSTVISTCMVPIN